MEGSGPALFSLDLESHSKASQEHGVSPTTIPTGLGRGRMEGSGVHGRLVGGQWVPKELCRCVGVFVPPFALPCVVVSPARFACVGVARTAAWLECLCRLYFCV